MDSDSFGHESLGTAATHEPARPVTRPTTASACLQREGVGDVPRATVRGERVWRLGRTPRATAGQVYRLLVSELVIDECGASDPSAARERLDELEGLPRLDITEDAHDLANALTASGAVPASEPRDALHIAIAAVHGVHYLVTWNFKHILNPHLQAQIAGTCREAGFIPPVICTPEQLKATEDDS